MKMLARAVTVTAVFLAGFLTGNFLNPPATMLDAEWQGALAQRRYFSNYAGQPYSVKVDASDVAKEPAWLGKGAPPMAPDRAIDLARTAIKRASLPLDDWETNNVSLTKLSKGRYIYVVTFTPEPLSRRLDKARYIKL